MDRNNGRRGGSFGVPNEQRRRGTWNRFRGVRNAREVIHHLAVYNLGLREVRTTRRRVMRSHRPAAGVSETLSGRHPLLSRQRLREGTLLKNVIALSRLFRREITGHPFFTPRENDWPRTVRGALQLWYKCDWKFSGIRSSLLHLPSQSGNIH